MHSLSLSHVSKEDVWRRSEYNERLFTALFSGEFARVFNAGVKKEKKEQFVREYFSDTLSHVAPLAVSAIEALFL